MDFIQEKNLSLYQGREDRSEISSMCNGWTACDADRRIHLCCQDHCKRCLPETWRTRTAARKHAVDLGWSTEPAGSDTRPRDPELAWRVLGLVNLYRLLVAGALFTASAAHAVTSTDIQDD